jgi:hypothetical protein
MNNITKITKSKIKKCPLNTTKHEEHIAKTKSDAPLSLWS